MATTVPKQAQTGSVVIGLHEIAALQRRVRDAGNRHDREMLLYLVGQQQENSARRRIDDTKEAPNGKRWAPWSEAYGRRKRKKGHQSMLVETHSLADSMTHQVDVSAGAVRIGSNMIYANAHLRGNKARGIPARPYLDTDGGFADAHDRAELRDVLRDWLRGLL